MTRRQSNNQWSGGIADHPAPKSSDSKNPLEIFSPRFFRSRRHPPNCLSFNGPNYQGEVSLISAGAIERHFEGKTPGEGHQRVLFLHENAPAHLALAAHKKLAYLGFKCLDHPPYSPDLAPSDYHLFPGLKRKNWNLAIFRPKRRSLLPRRTGWTNNLLNFVFWVACQS